MFSGVAVALPSIGEELDAGATALGLIETLFLAGSLAFLLPVGRLADAADKRTIYKLGLLGFGISSLLVGALSWMPAILVIRFFQGIFSAIFGATAMAIIAEIVPANERGRAFGRSIGAAYSGLTLGPVAAGYLIQYWGWRAVFYFGAVPLLGMTALVHSMMRSAWRRPVDWIHAPSAALVIASVLCLVAGSALLRTGAPGYLFLAAGVVLGAIFVLLQKKLPRPLLDVRALMSDAVLRNALFVQMLLYMNAYSSMFMMSIYMQVTLGADAKTSGQIIAVSSVLMTVMAPVSGILSDRFHPRSVTIFGVGFIMIAVLWALKLSPGSNLISVAAILGFQGLGFAFFSTPNSAIIMSNVKPEAVSMASALASKSRSLGMVLGMLVTGLLISVYIGNVPVHDHPDGFLRTMDAAYWILAVVTGAALSISIFTGRGSSAS